MCRSILSAPFAANRMKQQECPFARNICALVRGKLQKSSSWPRISSCLHVIWYRGLIENNSSYGLQCRGLCGTLITASSLSMFKPIRMRFLSRQTRYLKNIKDLPSPSPTDEIFVYEYNFFFFSFFFFKFWCFCNNRSIVHWANFNTVKLLGQAFFCIFFWLIYFYHFSPKTPLELVWMLLNQWIVISLQENNNNYSLIYVD